MEKKKETKTRPENRVTLHSRLAVRVFCALLCFVVLPLDLAALYVRGQYERYFREELSTNITNTLTKNESEIEKAFDNLSNVAYIYCTDNALQTVLRDGSASYYSKFKAFDQVTQTVEVNNLSTMEDIEVTMVDAAGQVYANWALNFYDYSGLQTSEIFNNSQLRRGNAVWQLFAAPFISGDSPDNKYIGISRGIVNFQGDTPGEYLGAVFVSVRQSELGQVLERFRYAEGDYIGLYAEDGTLLMQDSVDDQPRPALDTAAGQLVLGNGEGDGIQTIAGHTYLVCEYKISKKWIAGNQTVSVVHFTDYDPVASRVRVISRRMNAILLACLAAVTLIAAAVSWALVRPIHALASTMAQYELTGDYTFVDGSRRDEIGQLNRSFRDMDRRIKGLFEDLEKENRVKEQYKLDFLRAQLNPHFLFNTLGTIRWMAIAQHMTNIVQCIDALGTMLRYSMSKGEELVTLQEELQNLNGYIQIQNYRYGNRYRIAEAVGEELKSCRIIRFLLQPVIENAVLHAFADSEGEGQITLTARQEDKTLVIEIADNGKGIEPARLAGLNDPPAETTDTNGRQFNRIGIHNVQQQIRIRYGDGFGLHFESDGVHGTRCIYRLPLLKDPAGQSAAETVPDKKEENHAQGFDRG